MKQTHLFLCLLLMTFINKAIAQPTPDFLTNQEIFNFNIGDTLQFEYQEDMRSQQSLRIIEQHVYLTKWQSGDRQRWFYKRQISRDTQFCTHEITSVSCPITPQTHRFFDTLAVENLNNNVFSQDLPNHQHPLWEAYEVIGIDRNLYNARMFQERVWGYRGTMIHIERYAKGLGQVWVEQRSEVGRSTLLKLVFFNKSGETWGVRQSFQQTPQTRIENVRLYPNPAYTFLEISTDKQPFNNVKIYNVMGQQIFQKALGYETLAERLDLSPLSKDTITAQGLHFVQLFNGEKWIATAKVLLR